MSQSFNDAQIRRLCQRLKLADEEHLPDFEEVLKRPVRKPDHGPAYRVPMACVCFIVAASFVGYWFVWSVQNESMNETGPGVAAHVEPALPGAVRRDLKWEEESLIDFDVDQLRFVVEEYFDSTSTPGGIRVTVWSSSTESLLALNHHISLPKE